MMLCICFFFNYFFHICIILVSFLVFMTSHGTEKAGVTARILEMRKLSLKETVHVHGQGGM